MLKTVAAKMGIKEGRRAFFVNAPEDAVEAIALPALNVATKLSGQLDYIHLFVKTAEDFEDKFPKMKAHLAPGGMLWVSWPKGRQLGTDLTLPVVIKLGYDHGLVESTTLSINNIWSAIKFTHPKEGKVYNNSYGVLNR
ncbi:MAG: hypothetical protein EOP56_11380 [Sphingobacteriales bacterium]|nr:MAG: hypothetical protein EOP56_11380 [Sphingobacteriales bacterium]